LVLLGLAVILGPTPSSHAETPALTLSFNFSDYGTFIDELYVGSGPAGAYKVSVNSTVPLASFEVENLIYDSGSSYFPDGTYESGDEYSHSTTDFDVNPDALGEPYADTELAIVPTTYTFNAYYPDATLNYTYATVLGEELSLATLADSGVAVVTFSAVPEPPHPAYDRWRLPVCWLVFASAPRQLGWPLRNLEAPSGAS
jgi:hypothetical protein